MSTTPYFIAFAAVGAVFATGGALVVMAHVGDDHAAPLDTVGRLGQGAVIVGTALVAIAMLGSYFT